MSYAIFHLSKENQLYRWPLATLLAKQNETPNKVLTEVVTACLELVEDCSNTPFTPLQKERIKQSVSSAYLPRLTTDLAMKIHKMLEISPEGFTDPEIRAMLEDVKKTGSVQNSALKERLEAMMSDNHVPMEDHVNSRILSQLDLITGNIAHAVKREDPSDLAPVVDDVNIRPL
jgi:hypothetical protein